MSLEVIYQDVALAVVAKPAGLSSEQGLPQALRQLWGEDAYVGIVHRLDTPTTGLMVCARTPAAAAALTRQITDSAAWYAASPDARPADGPSFIKRYRAVVAAGDNAPLEDAGLWQDLLFKDSRTGRVYPVQRPRKGVRAAELEYRAAARSTGLALVEVTLHTGRTHQIRAQFAARRHPLWGDGRYGSRCKGALALQCMELHFTHPVTGQRMQFTLPPPSGEPWSLLAAGER